MRKPLLTSASGVGAALIGSLCCGGPITLTMLGVGASLGSALERLRPVFAVVMVVAFAAAFHAVYGRRRPMVMTQGARDSEPGAALVDGASSCPVPRSRTRDQAVLWVSAALASLVWFYPTWSALFH
ncbi:MAG TPA: mercuric transporter MerT family protein [Gemmatimonadaceae bacterium]